MLLFATFGLCGSEAAEVVADGGKMGGEGARVRVPARGVQAERAPRGRGIMVGLSVDGRDEGSNSADSIQGDDPMASAETVKSTVTRCIQLFLQPRSINPIPIAYTDATTMPSARRKFEKCA